MRSKFALLALLAAAAPAAAHVTLAVPTAKAGSHFVATFRVGHGCSGSPTTALRIVLPDTITMARPQPKPGWVLTIDHVRLAKPQKGDMGEPVTERVSAITWKGKLPADEFDEFSMMIKTPKDTGATTFVAIQTCAKGIEKWDGSDPAHPAPKLTVTPGDPHEAMPGMDMGGMHAGMDMPGAPPTKAAAAAPVTISDAWIRALPASVPSGGYFTLRNNSDKPLKLSGASSPACGTLMLHKSETGSGMAHMDDVTAIDIAPHATLKFAPGGYHLMCMDAKPAIKPGNSVPVILTFAGGLETKSVFSVRNASGR